MGTISLAGQHDRDATLTWSCCLWGSWDETDRELKEEEHWASGLFGRAQVWWPSGSATPTSRRRSATCGPACLRRPWSCWSHLINVSSPGNTVGKEPHVLLEWLIKLDSVKVLEDVLEQCFAPQGLPYISHFSFPVPGFLCSCLFDSGVSAAEREQRKECQRMGLWNTVLDGFWSVLNILKYPDTQKNKPT